MSGIRPENIEPCETSDSCLAEKLSALAPVDSRQAGLLAALEEERCEIGPGEVLYPAGEPTEKLYVLKKGWLVSELHDGSGNRSIVRVHHPGDIVGDSQIPYTVTPYRAVARSEAIVCPFPRENLVEVFKRSPRLSALLLTVAMIESAEQEDRARVFRRNSAMAKLALFAQQTFGRLKLMNNLLHDRFHCPLTQTDIGDVVGMTSVHVSRTFTKLEKEGALKRHSPFIQIVDEEKLSVHSSYLNRYNELDLSWLPEA
ncbi:Crp/Fnr family transcriptional regulator [Henriciella sp.]|uniref:Crp/Fnr family transcriptional regulator n=1 Tax=Henriciella sp. TaxID=1968823 RepID=UPI00261F7725|nr:Crp/Fnr family transcriptional regulator [Henriciella sp.]